MISAGPFLPFRHAASFSWGFLAREYLLFRSCRDGSVLDEASDLKNKIRGKKFREIVRGDNVFIPTTTGEEKAKERCSPTGSQREIPQEDY